MAILTGRKIHIDLDKTIASLTSNEVLKVGWVKGNRYPEEFGGKYVAEIAAQNEYGAPHKHIPPRPFMGPAVSGNKSAWLEIVRRGALKAARGDTTIPEVLNVLGRRAASDIKKAIRAVTSPPLSDFTIAARKARFLSKGNKKSLPKYIEKPLIDTALMFDSVTHAVEKE